MLKRQSEKMQQDHKLDANYFQQSAKTETGASIRHVFLAFWSLAMEGILVAANKEARHRFGS